MDDHHHGTVSIAPMRIYLAAFHSRRGKADTSSVHFKAAQLADYPWLLESFHYLTPVMGREIRSQGRTVFLDSGAYSMFTQGVDVDLHAYAQFIRDNQDIVHVASNVDAIGAGQERVSYERQKWLEAELEGCSVTVQPVHHVRDADEWLQRYLDEGHDYILLGGMVPETTAKLRRWLDDVWTKYLTNPDGTPRVKVHGFGLTTLSLMFRYPWFSVDSTSWVMASRSGAIFLDVPQRDGTIRDIKIDFSSRSPKLLDVNSMHFESLMEEDRRGVLKRLEELEAKRTKSPGVEAELERQTGWKQGYNPKALAESYGWRDHFNINYFRRAMGRGVTRFKRKPTILFE
ncbi:MAG: hypothetical protein AB7S93_14115 [Xanthobacteraceae bacterium]